MEESTYTFLSLGKSCIIEVGRIRCASLERAAERIYCRITDRGTGKDARFRPHFMGAKECAAITTTSPERTRMALIEIARDVGDQSMLNVLSNRSVPLTSLVIGNVPIGRPHIGDVRYPFGTDRSGRNERILGAAKSSGVVRGNSRSFVRGTRERRGRASRGH